MKDTAKTVLRILLSVLLIGWGIALIALFFYRLPAISAGGVISAVLGLLLTAAGILGILHRCPVLTGILGIVLFIIGGGFFLFTLVAHMITPAVPVSWGNLLTAFLAACFISLR